MFIPVSVFMSLVFIFESITTGSMGGIKIYKPVHSIFLDSSFIVTGLSACHISLIITCDLNYISSICLLFWPSYILYRSIFTESEVFMV